MLMIREERLDAPLRDELAAKCRGIELFTVGFAESLRPSILAEGQLKNRHRLPIYSLVSCECSGVLDNNRIWNLVIRDF